MTITVLPSRNEYTSNASQQMFNYTFKIFSITDLNVYITPAGQVANDSTDLTTAYTVSGVGDEDGGAITLTVGASINDLVTIVSNTPSSRTTDYQNNGDFRPDVVNADFDRVVSLVKKIEDNSNRAVLLQQSQQDPKPLSLPNPVSQSFMRWKTDLTGLENTDIKSLGSIALAEITTAANNVVDMLADTTATANRIYRTKDYYSTQRGGGTIYLTKTAAQAATDGDVIDGFGNHTFSNGFVAIIQPVFGKVTLRQFGCKCDGIANDDAARQAMFNFCGNKGFTAVISIGSSKIVTNLFIFGDHDIEGESKENSILLIDTQTGAGAGSNKYIIAAGIKSFGTTATAWNGKASNFTIKTTSVADFERAFFILASNKCHFQDVLWDFLDTDFTGFAKGGPIESGVDATWATSGSVFGTVQMNECRADLKHGITASEGFAFAQFENAEITNCEVYGVSDDAYALHNCERGRVTNCTATTISGRILCDQVRDFQAAGNSITKIPDPHTGIWHLSNFLEALMSSSSLTRPANKQVTFRDNTLNSPVGALIATYMRFQGVQESLTLADNIINNDSANGNSVVISVEATVPAAGAGWTGEAGNPDFSNSGIVRPRNVVITGNKDVGLVKGASLTQVGADAELLGPWVINDNILNSYILFSTDNIRFGKSNKPIATLGLFGVGPSACIEADELRYEFSSLSAPTFVAASHLTTSPVGVTLRAKNDGRIMGANTAWDVNGTSGQSVFVEIFVNAVSLISYSFGVGSAVFNERSFRNLSGHEIVKGDVITVEMWNSSGQLVNLAGNVNVLVQPL